MNAIRYSYAYRILQPDTLLWRCFGRWFSHRLPALVAVQRELLKKEQ